MAKFINTRKAVSEIEDLIKNADAKLILISPYLKLSKDFKELLKYRNSKDKITTVIFGKQELNPDEMKFLQELRFVILKYNEDLHAKCYVNDSRMIITSLNLYEFSMANNKEMGVLIDKNDNVDSDLFNEALKEVEYIEQTSQRFELNFPKAITTKKPDNKLSKEKPISTTKGNGFCIRTGVQIVFNPKLPMCESAYQSWKKFSNNEYPEKYCHFSGELSKGETCFSKPILKQNWAKAKAVQKF